MKALVYHGNRDLRLECVPDPEPGAGDIRLRMDYCGICATDVEEYVYGPKFIFHDEPNPLTGKKTPMITGHEITGTIEKLGSGVSGLSVGDRVVLDTMLTCEECWWCRAGRRYQCDRMAVAGFGLDGGLAEYLVWPASHAIPLPDNVTSEEAALVEPGSVALHAVRRGMIEAGQTVAVLGVGTVGMLAMQAAKSRGARVIAIDTRPMSLELAAELGADSTVNAGADDALAALLEETGGVGPDVVIDAAGGKTTAETAIRWVRRGGRVVLVAIYTATPPFDFNDIMAREVDVVGSLACERRDVEEIVALIAKGAVRTRPLISGTISLDEVLEKGFGLMMAPNKDIFRLLVSPSG
jgi:(R,R)-butanediol dehydrogenase/meso-butanediol dehydrogenase/diacetyl reductase